MARPAARRRPAARACATGCAGTRSATVGRSAVTSGDSPAPARSGSTSVSGPGQNAAASASARSSNTASRRAAATSGTCTISGLKRGRPLAAKIRATARSDRASPPRP